MMFPVTFSGSGSIETGNVSGGGGGGGRGGRIALGGGAGVLVTIVALLFGLNPGDIMGGGGGSSDDTAVVSEIDKHLQSCTYEKANSDTICRIKATTVSVDRVWTDLLKGYTEPKTVIFSDTVNTACGAASSSTGPFYCPADKTAYFDPTFFDMLVKMSGSDGPLSQMYVVAHEYGPQPDRFPAEGQQDGLTRGHVGFGAHRVAGRLLRGCVGLSRRQGRRRAPETADLRSDRIGHPDRARHRRRHYPGFQLQSGKLDARFVQAAGEVVQHRLQERRSQLVRHLLGERSGLTGSPDPRHRPKLIPHRPLHLGLTK
jgi:hypothetical protein